MTLGDYARIEAPAPERYRSPGRKATSLLCAKPLKTTLPDVKKLSSKQLESAELYHATLNRKQRRTMMADAKAHARHKARVELARVRREWRKVSQAIDTAPLEELQAAAARASDMLKATGT